MTILCQQEELRTQSGGQKARIAITVNHLDCLVWLNLIRVRALCSKKNTELSYLE